MNIPALLLSIKTRLQTLSADTDKLSHLLDRIPSTDSWLQAVKEHCPEAPLARIEKRALALEEERL